MSDLFIHWAAGCLVSASVMMWWFNTAIGVHILEIARAIGFRKKDTHFWSVPVDVGLRNDLSDFTKSDFEDWVFDKLNSKIAELLTCPGCLSMHISLWVALISQAITQTFSLELFLASWFGWPIVINILLNLTRTPSAKREITTSAATTPLQYIAAPGQQTSASAPTKPVPVIVKKAAEPTKAAEPITPENAQKISIEASHELLRSRGIEFHTDEKGTIIIDHMPRRETVISAFLDSERCPEEVPECVMLKSQMNKEIEEKGGAECTGCEKNKIRNKYRQILSNILKDLPELR